MLWLRHWLRNWLGVESPQPVNLEPLKTLISDLQLEVARLKVERYVPPQAPEPERKTIKTQTFKQYLDIVEQEQEARFQEELNAL